MKTRKLNVGMTSLVLALVLVSGIVTSALAAVIDQTKHASPQTVMELGQHSPDYEYFEVSFPLGTRGRHYSSSLVDHSQPGYDGNGVAIPDGTVVAYTGQVATYRPDGSSLMIFAQPHACPFRGGPLRAR